MLSWGYKTFISQANIFKYLCGLNVDHFNITLDCALTYIHLIPYPDCVGGTGHRRLESTELLLVPTICHHGFHQGIMGYIVGMFNYATVQPYSVAGLFFLQHYLMKLDLRPPSGYTLKKYLKTFVETGHGLIDLAIHAIDLTFQNASDVELNSSVFSNCKNTLAMKALVGIFHLLMEEFSLVMLFRVSIWFHTNWRMWCSLVCRKRALNYWRPSILDTVTLCTERYHLKQTKTKIKWPVCWKRCCYKFWNCSHSNTCWTLYRKGT